jgi:hypothetical protein
MDELVFRTEELSKEQIKSYYVPSGNDREIVDYLKSKTPVILVGSRGIGKTFLMKIAEQELIDNYNDQKVLPVFLTFRSASLLHTKNHLQFQTWMLAKICAVVSRGLKLQGKIIGISNSFSRLTGEHYVSVNQETKIEEIARKFEESYRNPDIEIEASSIPSIDDFLDIVEDLCNECDISRIVVFIDEAAHVLYAEQQRQFFTLFRELRSPYLTCNAAVYPGVTSYGNTFQPTHDAKIISVNRNVTEVDYVKNMKEIVLRQITDSHERTLLSQNGGLFTLLAYASSGNPRTLLKTVSLAPKMNSSSVNNIFREFYKTSIWSDHSNLAENYPSYANLIDWGRNFIEKTVLPEIKVKNDDYLVKERPRSFYFWVDRNAPQVVKEALRVLEYTGIIYENAKGIRATREGIGTRYMVNIGCLLSLESSPASSGLNIVKRASLKRMTEFSENHPIFNKLIEQIPNFSELTSMTILSEQLKKNINSLDLTEWQLSTLYGLSINTIGDLLNTSESNLMKARYVAEKRARIFKNAAFAAVFEYLLG